MENNMEATDRLLRKRDPPRFNKAETEEMERLLKEVGEEALDQNFCEKLARKFSREIVRSGKPAIQWKQVQNWFQSKQQGSADIVTSSNTVSNELVAPLKVKLVALARQELDSVPYVPVLNCAPENPLMLKGEKLPDISDLEFEAKSTKDAAWYDVAHFLAHRVTSSGETEVRVRFMGFGSEEDEWVNIKKGLRERSLPLEASECERVQVGDLVLCFQERKDQAIYFDAYILEIKRKLHDIRGCRCLFSIRYDHDNSEEKVQLRRLCRRPSY